MGTPELYICAQCIKITPCSNKEAKEFTNSITDNNKYYNKISTYNKEEFLSEEIVQGYLVQYKNLSFWTIDISKYIKYSEVKDNPLAKRIFDITKNLKSVDSSTGVSK